MLEEGLGGLTLTLLKVDIGELQGRGWESGDMWEVLGQLEISYRRATTPVFSAGGSQGQRSLAGYSPRGHRDRQA